MSSLSNVSLREKLQQRLFFHGFGKGILGVPSRNTKQPFSKHCAYLYDKNTGIF